MVNNSTAESQFVVLFISSERKQKKELNEMNVSKKHVSCAKALNYGVICVQILVLVDT